MSRNNSEKEVSGIGGLDELRETIHMILQEAALETLPVSVDPDFGLDFYETVNQYEVELIRAALDITRGKQNKAAKLLKYEAEHAVYQDETAEHHTSGLSVTGRTNAFRKVTAR